MLLHALNVPGLEQPVAKITKGTTTPFSPEQVHTSLQGYKLNGSRKRNDHKKWSKVLLMLGSSGRHKKKNHIKTEQEAQRSAT